MKNQNSMESSSYNNMGYNIRRNAWHDDVEEDDVLHDYVLGVYAYDEVLYGHHDLRDLLVAEAEQPWHLTHQKLTLQKAELIIKISFSYGTPI